MYKYREHCKKRFCDHVRKRSDRGADLTVIRSEKWRINRVGLRTSPMQSNVLSDTGFYNEKAVRSELRFSHFNDFSLWDVKQFFLRNYLVRIAASFLWSIWYICFNSFTEAFSYCHKNDLSTIKFSFGCFLLTVAVSIVGYFRFPMLDMCDKWLGQLDVSTHVQDFGLWK
jgi:hypothetical protein